jgi:uncharacterized protein (DUF1330 family)
MKAYMLAFVRIQNEDEFMMNYLQKAVKIVEKHGGRTIAANETYTRLEGKLPTGRVVILEFPSKQKALDFYNDPEYQPLKAWRHKNSESDSIIFEKGL